MTGLAAEENVAYPITGGFVAISLRFPTVAAHDIVYLTFADNAFENTYVVAVDLSAPVVFALGGPAGHTSVRVAQVLPANVDLKFWVDFSSDKFVVGIGSNVLLTTPHTLTSVSRMTITPDSDTIVTAGVCSKRGKF